MPITATKPAECWYRRCLCRVLVPALSLHVGDTHTWAVGKLTHIEQAAWGSIRRRELEHDRGLTCCVGWVQGAGISPTASAYGSQLHASSLPHAESTLMSFALRCFDMRSDPESGPSANSMSASTVQVGEPASATPYGCAQMRMELLVDLRLTY